MRKMPTLSVMVCCISTFSASARSLPPAAQQRIELAALGLQRLPHQRRRDVEFALGTLDEVGNELADDHARNDRFGNRVATRAD